ncbi:hypothetical protein Tco_0958370 [Tanacetum coccineum]
MACSLSHTVEEIKAYVKKQCDEDDVARREAIMGVITLFEQVMSAKEDLRKQYVECKDVLPERRALIENFLDDEAWKDYEFKKTLYSCVSQIQDYIKMREEEDQLLMELKLSATTKERKKVDS